MTNVCKWVEYNEVTWKTGCDNLFYLMDFVDGLPSDNGIKYCCYCGNRIEEVKRNQDDE